MVAPAPTASKTTAAPSHANRPRIVAFSSSTYSVPTALPTLGFSFRSTDEPFGRVLGRFALRLSTRNGAGDDGVIVRRSQCETPSCANPREQRVAERSMCVDRRDPGTAYGDALQPVGDERPEQRAAYAGDDLRWA